MERIINKVSFNNHEIKHLNVAAYARVSSGKDAMLHSLASQVSYFKSYIKSHSDWTFVEVYSDEAVTGTKDSRENFDRMIDDAKAGKIDLILSKSISRFARNTITMLKTIRELKEINVGIYFEKENINTLSSEGELLLTILASYAQDESRSVSENMRWRIKKNFEEGLPWGARLYGYKVDKYTFTIIEEEAKVIREIYALYLSGYGLNKISRTLNNKGLRTRDSNLWSEGSIRRILSNEYYTGDMVLQKTYRKDHLSKKPLPNRGELPKYYVEDNHPAIISKEDFKKVQAIFATHVSSSTSSKPNSPFTGLLFCDCCGKPYKRKHRKYGGPTWVCSTFERKGKSYCANHQVREDILYETACNALGIAEFDEAILKESVSKIIAHDNNVLEFIFKDNPSKSFECATNHEH